MLFAHKISSTNNWARINKGLKFIHLSSSSMGQSNYSVKMNIYNLYDFVLSMNLNIFPFWKVYVTKKITCFQQYFFSSNKPTSDNFSHIFSLWVFYINHKLFIFPSFQENLPSEKIVESIILIYTARNINESDKNPKLNASCGQFHITRLQIAMEDD